MSLCAWCQSFVVGGAFAWNLISAAGALAQQPTAPQPVTTQPGTTQPGIVPNVPTLPETEVIAEPPAPNLAPNFEPFQQPRILDSNPFVTLPTTGYVANSSTTGSWINIPTIVNPGTVDVVTRDILRDQQVINTTDIIRNIPNAVQSFGNGGDGVRRPDAFTLRGFELTSNNYRKNGFLDPTYTPRDYANIERVEVLKGPASVAYGAALPTGTVNFITKRAMQDRFASGYAQFGSHDFQRYAFDVNNMNQSGDILFRVNAAHMEGNSFRDYGLNDRTFVAPTMTILLDDDTVVTYEAEYNYDRRQYDTGIVAINGDAEALPASRFLGNPSNFIKAHDYRSTLSLTHTFNDDWSLYLGTSSIFYDFQNQGNQAVGAFPGSFDASGFFTNAFSPFPSVIRRQFWGGQKGYNHAAIANINGKFNGPLFRHNTVVGTELNWSFQRAFFPSTIPGVDSLLTIDPASAGPFTEVDNDPAFNFAFDGLYQQRAGFYVQDLVELTDRLYLNLGGRYDYIDQTAAYNVGFPFGNKQNFDRVTPKVGLTYQLVPEYLSLYGLYTTSFNPIGGAAFGFPGPGANLDPETGHIYEGGVKAQIFDNLLYTFSVFQIDRNNVATQADDNAFLQYQQADQRSKGIEMSLMGNWTERLSTVMNYSYTDVTQQDTNPAGDFNISGRVRGVPYNLANAWTRYNFIQDENRTFGIGTGIVYVGDRRGGYGPVPFELDSYTRVDLGLFGRIGRWYADTYIENITDTRYSTSSISQFQVFPGAPINARMQIGVTY